MTETERTVQVPESLIRRITLMLDEPHEAQMRTNLRALILQQAPTDEPEHDESCIVWTGDGFHCDCGSDDDRQSATPPRIEDMAPGTTEKPICGGAATNCNHRFWPPAHSMACPVGRAENA